MVQGLFDEEDNPESRAESEIRSDDVGDSLPHSTANSTLLQSEYTPDSLAETTRKSGLAFSAGIAFFGSIVFMLLLGWFADLLLGSSPWGIVIGIVFGSILGFIQFFRITSQIFGQNQPDATKHSFLSDENDKKP
jgi:F0F1-type ATP synthase assembly protein I